MPKERKKRNRVVVAMSGGMDSSVAAALLKKAGFNVIGVFMKLVDLSSFKKMEKRARKVAKILKIPFYVFNLEKEFKKRVVNYFLEGYKEGITPNPCVVCNKEIKFGLLLEKALTLDADYIATGHYARLRREILNPKSKILNYRYKLLRAKDKEKDQSYFLWMLKQKQLRRILFPIGNYTREEVENLAKKFKLPVLKARKSVEICFIPNADLRGFLKTQIHADNPPTKNMVSGKGKIVTIDGQITGEHEGLAFYTIGQRKGIGLPGGPYYVLDKNLKKNLLIVTKKEKDLFKKELICKKINWISGKEPKLPLKVKAKIRYRHQAAKVTVSKILNSKFYILKFNKPQRAITPGQSVVFYRGSELLGGGIIY